MRVFNWPLQITSLESGQARAIEAMVDTGATYTVIPGNLLREMGVSPSRHAQFECGDGRSVILDICEARATINGDSVITQIVFGEDDVQPLLGSYTLEGLLLAVDPYNRG